MLTTQQIHFIQNADSKALATYGDGGVNVVPVSVINVPNESTIVLYDFFMQKTVANIAHDTNVALCAWSGLTGLQIKGTVSYDTSSEAFHTAAADMLEKFPTRTLKGVLTVTVLGVYDVSVPVT